VIRDNNLGKWLISAQNPGATFSAFQITHVQIENWRFLQGKTTGLDVDKG